MLPQNEINLNPLSAALDPFDGREELQHANVDRRRPELDERRAKGARLIR